MRKITTILTKLLTTGSGRAIEQVKREQILFAQGKRGTAVFYVLTGTVALTVVFEGKEKIVSVLGPGSFVGVECIAAVRPKNMTSARAFTDCTVGKIERNEMLRLIENDKAFAALFRDCLLGRITQCQQVILDHLCNPSEERLARILISLANYCGDGNAEVVLPYIHQTVLAEVVGTTRSRVSLFMNNFRDWGFITYKNNASPLLIRTAELSNWLADKPHRGVLSRKDQT